MVRCFCPTSEGRITCTNDDWKFEKLSIEEK